MNTNYYDRLPAYKSTEIKKARELLSKIKKKIHPSDSPRHQEHLQHEKIMDDLEMEEREVNKYHQIMREHTDWGIEL